MLALIYPQNETVGVGMGGAGREIVLNISKDGEATELALVARFIDSVAKELVDTFVISLNSGEVDRSIC